MDLYSFYEIKYWTRFLKKKLRMDTVPELYAGRDFKNISAGNQILIDAIKSEKPFLTTRFGYNEIVVCMDAVVKKRISQKHLDSLCINAGFFPNDKGMAFKFGRIMLESFPEIDLDAAFFFPGEEYALAKYCPKSFVCANRAIEPWYSEDEPWTKYLAGKKVLVIHPFAKTIESQYEKKELLFENKDILPEFTLKTVKSVQTIAGEVDSRFSTWFEALDYMVDEASKIDFDITLIGCGAYGLPLAAKIKKTGKQAVHMGGALQLLFGIKGKRWDNHPVISKFYNDNWVRPFDEDVPKASDKVEGGCYW